MEQRVYPTEIELKTSINNGYVTKENELIDTTGAIRLRISVNASDYPKEEVEKAVKEICQTAVGYFR